MHSKNGPDEVMNTLSRGDVIEVTVRKLTPVKPDDEVW